MAGVWPVAAATSSGVRLEDLAGARSIAAAIALQRGVALRGGRPTASQRGRRGGRWR